MRCEYLDVNDRQGKMQRRMAKEAALAAKCTLTMVDCNQKFWVAHCPAQGAEQGELASS